MFRMPILRAARCALLVVTFAAPLAAQAAMAVPPPPKQDSQPLPEPETWALVGIALVAAITARGRNNRK